MKLRRQNGAVNPTFAQGRQKWGIVVLGLVVALWVPAVAADKGAPGKIVDSGSFGIFVNGRRVGTEKFQIEQLATASVATSEVTVEDGATKATQSAELKLSPTGDVQRYSWREVSPGKGESVVEPSNDFLVQHIRAGDGAKASDQPYILPASTVILDDYFFSHRELLTWRYLAAACKTTSPDTGCALTRAEFPVLIPRQRTSLSVLLEYAGREKVAIRGTERELDRFNLQSEGIQWAMWFDKDHKLVRILIAAEGVEVVRD
jgi:hypothetical protein